MNKAVKRISAVAVSATMLSSVAMAGGLAEYPQSMVKNEKFVGDVVVGNDAPADLSSASMIVDDLNSEVNGNFTEYEITAVKNSTNNSNKESTDITDSGTELNYGDSVQDVASSSFDGNDVEALEDGDLNDNDYEQELELDNGKFEYKLRDNLQEQASKHLYFDSGKVGSYTLDMKDNIEWDDNNDMVEEYQGKDISIMGNDYTISEISFDNNKVSDLVLLGGSKKSILENGEEVSYNGDTVKVDGIFNDKVRVTVNGESKSVDLYENEEIAGTNVLVTDISYSAKETTTNFVELVIGGDEVKISDNDEVELNGDEISDKHEDYVVEGHINSNDGVFNGFELKYFYENSDGFLLEEGQVFSDKVFDGFGISYDGTNEPDYQKVSLESTGAGVEVSGNLVNGNEFTREIATVVDENSENTPIRLRGDDIKDSFLVQDFKLQDSEYTNYWEKVSEGNYFAKSGLYIDRNDGEATFHLGSENGEELKTVDTTDFNVGNFNMLAASDYTPTKTIGISPSNMEGFNFLAGDEDNQYLYEFTDVDVDDNEYTVTNLFEDQVVTEDTELDKIDGDLADVEIETNDGMIKSLTGTYDTISFENEGLLYLGNAQSQDIDSSSFGFGLDHNDINVDENSDNQPFRINLDNYDTDDGQVQFSIAGDFASEGSIYEDNDDEKLNVNSYGTEVRYDSDESTKVGINVPSEQVSGKVSLNFGDISSVEEETFKATSFNLESKKQELKDQGYTIKDINEVSTNNINVDIDSPLKANETSLSDQNLIVVGGPAVNTLAAEMEGLEFPTYGHSGNLSVKEQGDTVTKYFEDNNNILVYGYTSEDTKDAVQSLVNRE